MRRLFRAIRRDEDGGPWLSDGSARGLGVRAGHDIAPKGDGRVHPGMGGPSVSPETPDGIPAFLRDEPVWFIDEDALPRELAYRDDPDRDSHGFIEPAYPMELQVFQAAVAATRELWRESA
jgi:hypothetical protein